MSRIGIAPITVPGGVDVTIAGSSVTVKETLMWTRARGATTVIAFVCAASSAAAEEMPIIRISTWNLLNF